jgi:glycine dehydrogenase subunit 1
MAKRPGIELLYPDRPFLNEFPVRMKNVLHRLAALEEEGILGGLPLGRWYPQLEDVAVFCCTELNDPAALDRLLAALGKTA